MNSRTETPGRPLRTSSAPFLVLILALGMPAAGVCFEGELAEVDSSSTEGLNPEAGNAFRALERSVWPAVRDTARDYATVRVAAGEGLLRTGLGQVQLPPLNTMEDRFQDYGTRLLGEERFAPVWDRYQENRRSQVGPTIARRGITGAMRFNRQLQRPQPASFYYDNFVRPRFWDAWSSAWSGRGAAR